MNQESFHQLQDDLSATSPSTMTPEQLRLLQYQITPETPIPPQEFLFRMFGTDCFPRGELVAVAGKAKSGKTFFNSMLICACLTAKTLAIERRQEHAPLRVLWYDTEQSKQSTQDILVNRILRMAAGSGGPSKDIDYSKYLYVFNLRCQNWQERRQLFMAGFDLLHPDLVILDGVRDLISDINDGVEAQQVTELLMKLAQQYNCCIACVLHQNKSSVDTNLRGWIGTELTNKVFEIYVCETLCSDSTFRVGQKKSRKNRVGRDLYYTLDSDTGLPETYEGPLAQNRDTLGRYVSTNPAPDDVTGDWDLQKLFTDALGGRSHRTFSEVMGRALKIASITDKSQYYMLVDAAIAQGIIKKEIEPTTGVEYICLVEKNLLPFI